MNKYDKYFDFRIATQNDVDAIMTFLKEEWSTNHILAKDRDFFIWMYGNEHYGDNDTISFALMLDKEGHIVGINGYVQYSPEERRRYVSSSMSKVKANLPVPMCGVELIKRFKELVPALGYYSAGTNPKTMAPIGEKIFHYIVGKMKQFYILNPEAGQYRIAKIKNIKKIDPIQSYKVQLVKLDSIDALTCRFDFLQQYRMQAYKSREYIAHRYYEHPIYHYTLYGVEWENQEQITTIIVCREVQAEGSKALRIVDILGNIENLRFIYANLLDLMKKSRYEYVDLLISDLDLEIASAGGWTLREEEDINIIPTYFEPFVQENVNTWFQKSDENITIFKADGDQDRPNSR